MQTIFVRLDFHGRTYRDLFTNPNALHSSIDPR